MNRFKRLKTCIVYFVGTFLWLFFFFWWISDAASDLLWQLMEPAKRTENIIDLGTDVDTVWRHVIKWWYEIDIDTGWIGAQTDPSIIVKATRLLLSLVIALSITMILYNWMMYIIQTWQWKEAKDLTKNIAFIVVWILISLFSVVIITLLQSVPKTLETELIDEWGNAQNDERFINQDGERIWISWKSIWHAIWKLFD